MCLALRSDDEHIGSGLWPLHYLLEDDLGGDILARAREEQSQLMGSPQAFSQQDMSAGGDPTQTDSEEENEADGSSANQGNQGQAGAAAKNKLDSIWIPLHGRQTAPPSDALSPGAPKRHNSGVRLKRVMRGSIFMGPRAASGQVG